MAEVAEPVGASTPATDETTKPTTTAEAATESKPTAEAGEKRKADDETTSADAASTKPAEAKPKKAKIARPPPVASSLMDVEKYKLEAPPPDDNTNELDATVKITTANLMLFNLHPLVKEGPLRKMLEDYGTVEAITVRSAFASRYGHVSFATTEEARKCYVGIHGAKLLHKTFLVQPSMASAVATPKKETAPVASAGASAAAAAAATKTDKGSDSETK